MIEQKTGDFYWAYADILRGIGINESMYDQRIMAFMALKLLVDNELVVFNFDWRNRFGLTTKQIARYGTRKSDTKEIFRNIVSDVVSLGNPKKLHFMTQDRTLNPDGEHENVLFYINHKRTFPILDYIDELESHYLEMVLDIYVEKANFKGYPKEHYKDLYETTIARMKKLSGDLTGQHFTQKSVIHLMCETAVPDLKRSDSPVLAIYDPACGTGSMLMESAYYFDEKINHTEKGNRRRKTKSIEVYGQEMHGQTWFLCKVFLEISEIKNTIAYGNTLTKPAFEKINGDESFDFIIANPPFGVDWKHDYQAVAANMQLGEDSNFHVVKDAKGKPVLPKKSDGQFLFMLHILKLLERSRENGKHAKAAVISSTGLVTSGKETSAEGVIRKYLFQSGYVDTLLEQPKAMFTNTDIATLIWFLDNQNIEKRRDKTFLVKTDNAYVNEHFSKTKVDVLYAESPIRKEKQKHYYPREAIRAIVTMIDSKIVCDLFAKYKTFSERYALNFEEFFNVKIDLADIEATSKFNFGKAYDFLSLALFFEKPITAEYPNFGETVDALSSYIDGTYIDKFREDYQVIYNNLKDMIIAKEKKLKERFYKEIRQQKQKEIDEINHVFERVEEITNAASIALEIKQ